MIDTIHSNAQAMTPSGTVVLLLDAGDDPQAAAEKAVARCREWASRGRRVVLADMHFEDPQLHGGLDVANLEGVSDVFLYGASVSRLTRRFKGESFLLLPAGTYVPDAGEIYRNSRWSKLVAGFRDTNAIFALFAPSTHADLEALAEWSDEAVLIGADSNSSAAADLRDAGFNLMTGGTEAAVVAPSATIPATQNDTLAIAEVEEEFRTAAATRSRYAEVDQDVPLHRPPQSDLELPPPPLRRQRRKSSTTAILIIFLVALVATAAYLFATLRPDLVPMLRSEQGSAIAAVEPQEVVPAAPQAVGEGLYYSVHVRAFTSLSAAQEGVEEERRRLEGVPFFISPQEIQGTLYYRILSGMMADTLDARALRDQLVDQGSIDGADTMGILNLIEFTPLAFDLGQFASPGAAAARGVELVDAGVPTYQAEVPYSDGSLAYQLYAGAYPDSTSAEYLRDLLNRSQIEAPLRARTGTSAALPE